MAQILPILEEIRPVLGVRRPHGGLALPPEAIVLGDLDVSEDFRLAGQAQVTARVVRGQGTPGAIAPVRTRHLTHNRHCTGAAGANAVAVNQRCLTVVQVNVVGQQHLAQISA